jgi:hypothetical protein
MGYGPFLTHRFAEITVGRRIIGARGDVKAHPKKWMAKGWLEGGNAVGTCGITRSGEEALSAPPRRRRGAAS